MLALGSVAGNVAHASFASSVSPSGFVMLGFYLFGSGDGTGPTKLAKQVPDALRLSFTTRLHHTRELSRSNSPARPQSLDRRCSGSLPASRRSTSCSKPYLSYEEVVLMTKTT